jgi:hypothetical protein
MGMKKILHSVFRGIYCSLLVYLRLAILYRARVHLHQVDAASVVCEQRRFRQAGGSLQALASLFCIRLLSRDCEQGDLEYRQMVPPWRSCTCGSYRHLFRHPPND